MLKCEKCGVTVSENHSSCPLCQGDLTGESDGRSVFPKIRTKNSTFYNVMRFVLFITVVGVIVCLAVNLAIGGNWWLYAAAGVASGWLVVSIMMKMRHIIAKCILWTTATVIALAIIWDFSTGYNGWSVDYILPIACCCAMLAMFISARIKRQQIEDYIAYMIMDILFGIVSLILLLTGVVATVYPSVVCVALSAIFLSALLIFQGKALFAEISRRMHM